MTYDEIIAALNSGKCESTISAFERAVEDEKRALFELPSGKWKLRDGGRAARKAAQEFYADDITEQLKRPVEPTPTQMLTLRRFPVVWAVAEVLRTNNLTGLLQGKGKVRGNKHFAYASSEVSAYPHEGACPGCRDHEPPLCNVCGDEKGGRYGGGCTNGRCDRCHAALCTPGGNTSPGHGFGRVS